MPFSGTYGGQGKAAGSSDLPAALLSFQAGVRLETCRIQQEKSKRLCQENFVHQLSQSVTGALHTFGFWLANGTVGQPILESIDYSCIFREPSALEQALAIFANVLRFDETGRVMNERKARADSGTMDSVLCGSQLIEPPLERWETHLHKPPPV